MSFSKLRRRCAAIALLLALPAVAAGCGGSSAAAATARRSSRRRPSSPTWPATSRRARTSPRCCRPTPTRTSTRCARDDVKALASADIVLRSGGEVDEWLDGALDSAGVDEQDVVDAGAAAGMEGDDPHWWQDPRARREGRGRDRPRVRRGRAAGPLGGRTSRACSALDAGVRACMDRVPAAQRKLVTSHDALGYYARRYGIEVIGTVIPRADDRRAAVGGRRREARGRRSRRDGRARRSSPRAR